MGLDGACAETYVSSSRVLKAWNSKYTLRRLSWYFEGFFFCGVGGRCVWQDLVRSRSSIMCGEIVSVSMGGRVVRARRRAA